MSTPPDPMAEIRASFFIECDELLEALQDGLQTVEDGEADSETINVVFRAVHSIKGGAGAFGLEGLVRFAHRFETALDEVRAGRMEIGSEVLSLSFQAGDHLSDLVRACRDETDLPEERSIELLAAFDSLLGTTVEVEPEDENISFQPMTLSLDLDLPDENDAPAADFDVLPDLPPIEDIMGPSVKPVIKIYFKPFPELFETGNEPRQFLRALQELGKATITCDVSEVPPLNQLVPDMPYLGWTILLETESNEAEVTAVFEFVEGLCALEISTLEPEAAEPATLPEPEPELAVTEPEKPAAPEVPPAAAAPEPPAAAPPAPKAKTPQGVSAAKAVVRVDLDRIERLVNLVGELVINQAMLSQSLETSGLSPHSDAMNGLEEFHRLTRDIQDSVMMIRAQPVKSLFQRMSRIVREASTAVGKNVRLVTVGETTEVDKTVIERLADPLTHMIRNAVDHGLESPEARVEAGKPTQGNVNLTAAHRSGRVIIEISDDGAGINRPKVRQIAIDKGLIPADSVLSDTEIDNLLFLPGFSTAAEVTDLSGRGVGMDVVRTAIQALGGGVTITSTPGEGTCFSISLPLTLAVLDGMIIQVADETLVVPLTMVIETMTLVGGEVQQMRPGNQVIQVREQFVPIIDLGLQLGYRSRLEDFTGAIALLISLEDGNKAALIIDAILDQRQVVIKGLNDSLYRAPGVAAATILGDGQIALILDPPGIVTLALSAAQDQQLEGLSA